MTQFETETHGEDPRRLDLLRIADAALEAIDPGAAILRAVTRDGPTLHIGSRALDLTAFDRAIVLGFGKGAVPMGRAAVELLDGIATTGVLVTNAPGEVASLEVVEGGHPVPDGGSLTGGRRVLGVAQAAGPRDVVVVLISGGGSALLAVPAAGLTLQDLHDTSALLLKSGADIVELNTVRKHLSAVKGGRLGEALSDAGAVVTLILSDVIGNPLDVIASGPTVPDPTTFEDALAVLDRYDLRDRVAGDVRAHLEAGAAGGFDETPIGGAVFERQMIELVADAGVAARAGFEAATSGGWTARLVTTELAGEAREVGRELAAAATDLGLGEMLILAGETTVTVTGDGRGGRNQELALAASIALADRGDVVVLSLGTDGIDGMSDAAGAFGDGTALARGAELGLDAVDYLARNDSSTFLEAVGDAVICGPTGTNVGDLILVCRTG